MKRDLRRWLAMILLIGGCIGLPACGGGDDGGQEVTGDSAEGVPVEANEGQENAEGAEEGESVPAGGEGVEVEEVGEEESLTDGQ